jgi:hypothetical protein
LLRRTLILFLLAHVSGPWPLASGDGRGPCDLAVPRKIGMLCRAYFLLKERYSVNPGGVQLFSSHEDCPQSRSCPIKFAQDAWLVNQAFCSGRGDLR